MVKETGTKLTRQARDLARSIGENAKKKTEAAKEAWQQLYRALVDQTQAVIQQARQVLPQLKKMKDKYAQSLVSVFESLVSVFENFTPLAEQVIDQTERRMFQQEQVPAQEKIVSIFEPHTDIICRGKETKPVEYGHKIWLAEVDGGIVCHYRILDGTRLTRSNGSPASKRTSNSSIIRRNKPVRTAASIRLTIKRLRKRWASSASSYPNPATSPSPAKSTTAKVTI
ncbi:MAG: hypothetical protein JZU60_01595 [Ilumatobacteraceae bacterium]|nr:hypothetical protein [Ilumatobacteraceae bacterium]